MTFEKVPSSVRYLLAAFAIVVAIATASPVSRASGYFRDFNAFYCAGAAIASGHDPYLAEPIGTCERRPRPAWVQSGAQNLSLPAPLPPYALALFVVLSRLPLVTAAYVWSLLLCGALAATVWSIRKTTGIAVPALLGVFAIGGYSAIFLGEIAAVAVAAVAVGVMLLEREKPAHAALAAAVALIEPHVGLPAVLALFCYVPATRVTLACAGTLLGALSVVLVGTKVSLEYLSQVLPSHALSEVGSERQLSLTSVLHSLGAPNQIALGAGFASYYGMILIGLLVAYRFRRRRKYDGFILAAPVALALVGGVFIHVAQLQAALPAALLGFARTSGRARALFGLSLVLLAVPWVQFTFLGLIFVPLAGLTVAFLTRVFLKQPLSLSAIAALTATGFISVLIFQVAAGPPESFVRLPNIVPGALAEMNWALHVAVQGARDKPTFLLARIPSWCGICLLALAILNLANRSRIALPKSESNAARAVGNVWHGVHRPAG